jgi:hypothetical protein
MNFTENQSKGTLSPMCGKKLDSGRVHSGTGSVVLLRDGAARLARHAHNVEVVGSNPTPATNFPARGLSRVTEPVRGRMSTRIAVNTREIAVLTVYERTGEGDRQHAQPDKGRALPASPFNFRACGARGFSPELQIPLQFTGSPGRRGFSIFTRRPASVL